MKKRLAAICMAVMLAAGFTVPAYAATANNPQTITFVLNKNSLKFHKPGCSAVDKMKETNKEYFYGTREEAINKGYVPCKICNP
jgi:DNA-entry nuclease